MEILILSGLLTFLIVINIHTKRAARYAFKDGATSGLLAAHRLMDEQGKWRTSHAKEFLEKEEKRNALRYL